MELHQISVLGRKSSENRIQWSHESKTGLNLFEIFLVFWNQEYFYHCFKTSNGYIIYADIFNQIIDMFLCAAQVFNMERQYGTFNIYTAT